MEHIEIKKEEIFPLLEKIGFDDKNKYDKLFEYFKNHAKFENEIFIRQGEDDFDTKIFLALKALTKINLEDVIFVNDLNKITTQKISVDISNDDFYSSDFGIRTLDYLFIDETVKVLNKILKKYEKLYIYILFSEVRSSNGIVDVFHRIGV